MGLFSAIFGRKTSTAKPIQTKKNPDERKISTIKPVQKEKNSEYDFTTPGLSQTVTNGRNVDGNVAAVVLNIPEEDYHKVIINRHGFFKNFPGIIRGQWTRYLTDAFNFESGIVHFKAVFESQDDGYRCLWEIQPDGKYLTNELDDIGMENASEIILYADLDERGNFTSPFRIYKIDGKYIDNTDELAQPCEENEDKNEESKEKAQMNSKVFWDAREKNFFLAQFASKEVIKLLEEPLEKYRTVGFGFAYNREEDQRKRSYKNICQFEVEKIDDDRVSFRFGARKKGSDKLFSYYISEAGKTQDDIKKWLQNMNEHIVDILESAYKLSDRVDYDD